MHLKLFPKRHTVEIGPHGKLACTAHVVEVSLLNVSSSGLTAAHLVTTWSGHHF